MTPRKGPKEMDDVTVAERIRSDALRELNRSHINVNVEKGVAVLRGSLDDERLAAALERRVRRIPGVQDVRNMIHTNDAMGLR
jgi:osmotically-inducible protein OsmY